MHALISLRPRNFISNHASTVASAAASTKAPSSTISKTPHFARFSHVNQSFLQSNSHNSQMKSLNTASDKSEHVIILGGGIAGLSTARYLLSNTQQNKNLKITLIDKNIGTSLKQHSTPTVPSIPSTYESYIQGQIDVSHFNIPSRRNGNMLCPSLTTPWTSRSLWNEAFLPVLKSFIPSYTSSNNAKSDVHPPSITFDWASMALDKNMWSFGMHLLLQKLLLGRPEHQSNKSILEYSMKSLDDPSDDLVQSIRYGRWANGTRLLDGSISPMDSSGDIGLFCRGLLDQMLSHYGDRIVIASGEEVTGFDVDGKSLLGVTTLGRNGERKTRDADKVVVALGVESTALCKSVNVPCPLYPVKGHLVTVSSKHDFGYNISLHGGVGYAAPMANIDSEGRRLYRLSGFVDFTTEKETNHDRVEALLDAARVDLPDFEMIDSSACHRPVSADDRPLIGPSRKYSNLFLCAGFGSRGWSIGLGCGKLLASQILGMECDIDPGPYLPCRFDWSTR